jgi:hypothetical protein
MPPFDPSQYFEGPFTAGGYYPTNQVSMSEADVRGKAQAEATAAGQQKAIDMEKEVQRKAAEELNKQRMQRFNMLTDLYRRPTQFDASLGEEEIQKRANERGISLNEARNIAYNEQAQAEGRASDLINKTNAWKQSNQPLPTYSLGKDYFGRDITTNRPAATAQEQAQRIEAYNQAPGSLSQYALSPEEKKIELAHISNLQDMNKANMLNQQTSQAATNGWAWNSSAGRYTRTNELTSGQQAAMRERLKLSPSFIFQPGKATETPAPTAPATPTPTPATVTPTPAPMARNEPAVTPAVKQEVTKVVELTPAEATKQPSLTIETATAPAVAKTTPPPARDIPEIETDKLLASMGINTNVSTPVASTQGAGRRGYTQADKDKADLAQAESDLKRISTSKQGRSQTIDLAAARKAAAKVVAFRRKLGMPPAIGGGDQFMYAGTEKLGGQ